MLKTIQTGSNYPFEDKLQIPNVARSTFDLSHLNTMTIPDAGLLIPIALFETVPQDKFDLSVDALIRVMPQVVPLMSKQRLYMTAFYSRLGDLWTGATTFMTKGYTGKILKTTPSLNANNTDAALTLTTSESLQDYLGIPIGIDSVSDIAVSALPFMMYKRIHRDYYINKNVYTTDQALLPDDDHDFMLNDAGTITSFDNESEPTVLNKLEYRFWPEDYFTSSLPWPQRGDTPTLEFTLETVGQALAEVGALDSALNFKALKQNLFKSADGTKLTNIVQNNTNFTTFYDSSATIDKTIGGLYTDSTGNSSGQAVEKQLYANLDNVVQTALSSITLDKMRQLAIAQTELERMARTDGSYGEFGLTFFNKKSKIAQDYKPLYIGGSYQNLNFTEVLQTSESSTTPLGTFAGHGISAPSQNSYLGTVDCDDYGLIMILASIMPDTYYTKGLDRVLHIRTQSDMYLPERSKLGMRAIYNKEIYISKIPNIDNDLFAYQNPFDELRYSFNKIHGQIADSSKLSYYPYTQSREFASLPTYSESFLKMSSANIRKDYLSAPTESAYIAQFYIKARAVRPLPFKPIPAQIVN